MCPIGCRHAIAHTADAIRGRSRLLRCPSSSVPSMASTHARALWTPLSRSSCSARTHSSHVDLSPSPSYATWTPLRSSSRASSTNSAVGRLLALSSSSSLCTDDAAANLKIAFVAAAAVGVWDWLVTLNEERRYIWPRRLSLVKIAFLLNRYCAGSWAFAPVTLTRTQTSSSPSCRSAGPPSSTSSMMWRALGATGASGLV